MQGLKLGGTVLFAVGVGGYVPGVFLSYAGRAFALTAAMVGLSLVVLTASGGGGSR